MDPVTPRTTPVPPAPAPSALRHAWEWVKGHTWAAWVVLGTVLVVIVRVVFHGLGASDAFGAERTRIDHDRAQAQAELARLQMDQQRAALVADAQRKAAARAQLAAQTNGAAAKLDADVARIQTMDADAVAAEWRSLREGR